MEIIAELRGKVVSSFKEQYGEKWNARTFQFFNMTDGEKLSLDPLQFFCQKEGHDCDSNPETQTTRALLEAARAKGSDVILTVALSPNVRTDKKGNAMPTMGIKVLGVKPLMNGKATTEK